MTVIVATAVLELLVPSLTTTLMTRAVVSGVSEVLANVTARMAA